MAIGDDFTIDYIDKKITHTSGTTVYTLNALYSYLQDTFDELLQMDDTIPMSAPTPIDYILLNGWFMDDVTLHYIRSGGLSTSGWNGQIQILTLDGSYTNCVAGDIGKTVLDDGVDAGKLLYYDNTLQKWWIRSTSTIADNSVMTISTGTGAGAASGAAITGETVWANPYSLGAIQNNTRLYVSQNDSVLTDWWSDGHIDILVKTQEAGALVDSGFITVFGRQYSKEAYHFRIDLSSGSRQPIPLATGNDLNNTTGHRVFTGSSGTGIFVAEEIITGGTSGAKGIITSVAGTESVPIIRYYLIDDVTTDFQAAETCTGSTSGSTCTTGSPANYGPALNTSITVAFGATSHDLNNGNGSKPYSITLDCNSQVLSLVYERVKYLTRRGETNTLNGLEGQQYIGSQLDIDYTGQSGNFTEGLVITGGTSGATARIVSDVDSGTTGTLILSNIRGTFQSGETIADTSTGSATTNGTGRLIAEVKKSPFGTFAGGIFFAAPGVWLANVASSDAKNLQLIDDNGTVQNPPNTQNVTVQSVVAGDRILVAESTGAGLTVVKKDQFSITGSISTGSGTITVDTTIPNDTPSSGIIRVVRPGLGEERYVYTSWTGSIFTLSGVTTEDYTTSDTAYVPFIDKQAASTEEFVQIIYVSDKNIVARVRLKGILPFESSGTLSSSGYTVSAIRTIDTIVT